MKVQVFFMFLSLALSEGEVCVVRSYIPILPFNMFPLKKCYLYPQKLFTNK